MKTGIKIIAVLLAIILTMGVLPSCSVIKPILKNENKGLPDALTTSTDDLERVKEVVEAGADVNKVSAQFGPYASPLWYSIRNGQRLIPAYLLSKGADPNFVDDRGISILMFAVGADAEWGTTYDNATDNDSYKTLLNDKRTKINLKGKLGFTALDYACRDSGHLDKVNYLISHGAIITPTTMKCALEGYPDCHSKD